MEVEHVVLAIGGTTQRRNAYVSDNYGVFFVDKLQQCFSSNVHFLNVIFIYFKIACAVGFKGHNCGTKCTYPTYGQDCQMICFCSIKDCDFVSGCRRSLKGI